ncbi:MAG: hypothetical protein SAL70_17885 [Scytonema sp. PMC 1070.18]|nr:hypothetical protein [Scytonema sp. PMC 1070.18]
MISFIWSCERRPWRAFKKYRVCCVGFGLLALLETRFLEETGFLVRLNRQVSRGVGVGAVG